MIKLLLRAHVRTGCGVWGVGCGVWGMGCGGAGAARWAGDLMPGVLSTRERVARPRAHPDPPSFHTPPAPHTRSLRPPQTSCRACCRRGSAWRGRARIQTRASC
eukprot:283715-Chlamydomonas_euryale.AAC.1